jgi:hypothetical protein
MGTRRGKHPVSMPIVGRPPVTNPGLPRARRARTGARAPPPAANTNTSNGVSPAVTGALPRNCPH